MNVNKLIDLYTDFLIYTPQIATSTLLSKVLDGKVSHDKFTRMLSKGVLDSKKIWDYSKVVCQEIRTNDAVLIIDDSVEEKRYSKANGLIQWHYDHTQGRSIKGVNFITALYNSWQIVFQLGLILLKKKKNI